jgi:hypothetical protein
MPSGVFDIGGFGQVGQTTLQGSLISTGQYNIDVDFNKMVADQLIVSQQAEIKGTVRPFIVGLPEKIDNTNYPKVSFISAKQGLDYSEAVMQNSLALNYALSENNPAFVAIDQADFAPQAVLNDSGTDSNLAEIANALQTTWVKENLGSFAPIFTRFGQFYSVSDYQDELKRFSASPHAIHGANQATLSTRLADALHSCPVYPAEGSLLTEQSCFYMRTNHSKSKHGAGIFNYQNRSHQTQIGGQKELSSNWFLGGILSVGQNQITDENKFSDANGKQFSLGAVVKKRLGSQWLVGLSTYYNADKIKISRDLQLHTKNKLASRQAYPKFWRTLAGSLHCRLWRLVFTAQRQF